MLSHFPGQLGHAPLEQAPQLDAVHGIGGVEAPPPGVVLRLKVGVVALRREVLQGLVQRAGITSRER